jgi:hypothetical protein
MKASCIGKPEIYLGAKMSKVMMLPNCVEVWAMSPSKYVQGAFNNAEDYLK